MADTLTAQKMATKRKLDEQRKKEEEEDRLAEIHREFVDTFADGPKLDKTWVKAGTADDERRGKSPPRRELYKPKSKLAELAESFKSVQPSEKEEKLQPKPETVKRKSAKKSNLEIFKEELRAMQEERDERRRLREHIKECEDRGITPTLLTSSGRPSRFEAPTGILDVLDKDDYSQRSGPPNFDADMSTTNLYLGNINPKMSEQEILELFGKFGPLASIKIMYPRTEDERSKSRHTGFVGFMRRQDAENAYEALKGETIMAYDMRLSWGKSIPIPPRPIYITPTINKENLPPPPSGLPFNAQPPSRDWKPALDADRRPDFRKNLDQTMVKIVIPTERPLLCLIHRMVEYVVREGPLFEAMIMNREINNPLFRFLFDNKTPAHTYYRWKLFSILQGDDPYVWNTKPFQMYEGGSIWIPPKMNPFMQGKKESDKKVDLKKAALSERQRDRLEGMLRDLTTDRVKIGELMVWCLEHAETAEEIVEILTDSLSIVDTPISKKIARLFVVSDILYNTGAKLPNVSYFRKYFESAFPVIFKCMNETYEKIDSRLKAESFKQKVMACFRAWEDWVIYPLDLLIKCQNIFLGLFQQNLERENVDGAPLSPNGVEADLDGEPLQKQKSVDSSENGDDIDGQPLQDDLDGKPIKEEQEEGSREDKPSMPKFAPSKWETVDEEVVKKQAMTSSKWEQLEPEENSHQSMNTSTNDDLDGEPMESRESSPASEELSHSNMSGLLALSAAYTPKTDKSQVAKLEMTEGRRSKLRDIEVKVMKYQDELEAGKRSRKVHMSISEQVEHYRQKLVQKELDEAEREQVRGSEKKKRHEDRSPSPRRRASRRSRSNSKGRSARGRKSRSRSPKRSKRSRSVSSERYKHKKNRK